MYLNTYKNVATENFKQCLYIKLTSTHYFKQKKKNLYRKIEPHSE